MALLRRVALAAAAALLAMAPSPAELAASAPPVLTEAQAKAGFLYNCARFVSWPPAAVSRDALVIGIVGDETLAALVKDMDGRHVDGRVLRVLPAGPNHVPGQHHILFVAGEDARAAKAVLRRVGDGPVLTVGESDTFTSDGGVVRLYTDQGRLRFEINMTRAEEAGLKVSAKMLGLARIVR